MILQNNTLNETLVMVKPDAVERQLLGSILSVFEAFGRDTKSNFQLERIQSFILTDALFDSLYGQYKDKSFYIEYKNSLLNKMVVVLLISGENILNTTRDIMGATDPKEAANNTIRGLFGISKGLNSIHSSDSYESFLKERKIFFDL